MQRSQKEIIWLSLLACMWAIQAAVVLQQLLGLGHAPVLMGASLLQEATTRMAAKWDLVIYLFFILVALMAGKALFKFYRGAINYGWLIFEAAVTFLMVSALFKIVVYDNSPKLAQWCLIALIIVAIFSKLFLPELKQWTVLVFQRLGRVGWWPYSADRLWVALIVLMIYMPDLERVMALIYMGDWLHHFDFIVMCVGWASLWGQLPYVDVFSQYGVGVPILFAKIIHALGPFDYVPALRVMMWFVIIYFILTYFFVRYWLKSALMAGVAFLLVFRLQMFHYGVSPLVWSVPSACPIRFGLDILWMTALLLHLRSGKSRWLIGAALYSGFAPYYMTSGGMCLMVTFYVYLFVLILLPSFRRSLLEGPARWKCYWLCWGLPIISALMFFGITYKGHMLQKEFWHNLVDYMDVFPRRASLPMYESLKYRHFWAFFMSMVMPFTYLATMFYIGVGLYTEKIKKEYLLPALLCIDGLANYQYYVVRAAITSYYVDVLPFVLVVCFWFDQWLQMLPLVWRKRARAAAVVLSFYALLTNHNYLAYPNLMNFSRNPMTDNLVIQRFPDRQGYFNQMYKRVKEEDKLPINDLGQTQEDIRSEDDFKDDEALVDYFRTNFNFKEDADLIRRLTAPGERVALISSYEGRILMQADRPPFFYHFPLLTSRPMTFRTIPNDAAHIPTFVNDTIGSIEQRQPSYIFMEKVFLQDTWPSSYQDTRSRLVPITIYVRAHYQPFEQGKYLIAMKRKS